MEEVCNSCLRESSNLNKQRDCMSCSEKEEEKEKEKEETKEKKAAKVWKLLSEINRLADRDQQKEISDLVIGMLVTEDDSYLITRSVMMVLGSSVCLCPDRLSFCFNVLSEINNQFAETKKKSNVTSEKTRAEERRASEIKITKSGFGGFGGGFGDDGFADGGFGDDNKSFGNYKNEDNETTTIKDDNYEETESSRSPKKVAISPKKVAISTFGFGFGAK